KVTVIALIGRLIVAALPKASAATRYLITLTTFGSMLALPLFSLAGIEWRLSVLPQSASAASVTTTTTKVAYSEKTALEETTNIDESVGQPSNAAPGAISRTRANNTPREASWTSWLPSISVWSLLLTIVIAAAFGVRMLIGIAGIVWI